MQKNQLQQLAQRNYLSLPTYSCIRDGPDHAPRFKAAVTYNGNTFESPEFCSTYKQAQLAAAEVALNALTQRSPQRAGQNAFVEPHPNVRIRHDAKPLDSPKGANKEHEHDDIGGVLTNGHRKEEALQHTLEKPSPSESLPRTRIQVVSLQALSESETSEKGANKERRHNTTANVLENRHCTEETIQQSQGRHLDLQFPSDMHKNQLQQLAQKGGFNLPSYSCIREGPPHAPRFKATVTFNGETFESPVFCSTLRQAEHSAATVALKSLSEKGRSLDESGVYKNLLQEVAQKEGIPLPVYSTSNSGLVHVPVFTSTVKVAGKVFSGAPAKTRKQAEKNAAMVAWSALKQSGSQSGSTSWASDKGGQADHEPTVIECVPANSNTKEETRQQLDVQSVSLASTRLGGLCLQEPSASETSDKGTDKDLEQNMMATVLANRHGKEDIDQYHNKSSPTQFPSGTKIRVFPCQEASILAGNANALPCSSRKWVAVEVIDDALDSQNNVSSQDE